MKTPIVLGSQSPRRQYLLKEAGIEFTIQTKAIEETFPDDMNREEVAAYIAIQKAKALAPELVNRDSILITADTTVVWNNQIFGKPTDEADAFRMIRQLADNKHEVITGCCILKGTRMHHFSVRTAVYFLPLTDEQIHYYIKHYRPFDKAGAYAIQEWIGMVGIEKIEGCYFNVVGLPVSQLLKELQAFQ